MNRRELMQSTLAAGAGALLQPVSARGADEKDEFHGRIQQSIVFWCFNAAGKKWNIDKICEVAVQLKCKSVELAEPAQWGTLKKHGLVCAIAPNGMPGAPRS
jgi:hypothetical protein